MPTKVAVIGSGFSGIAAASCLAHQGYEVQLLEKNSTPGGRARSFTSDGFLFDMGPSWYWMPDVFEKYFGRFGKKPSDYYKLTRLDPSYKVFYKDSILDIPAGLSELKALFEQIEKGSSFRLDEFLAQARYKYDVGMDRLVYKPGQSLTEFYDVQLLQGLLKLDVFTSIHKHVRKYFKDERILQLMEFPILFLGATPKNTPALYSLMNYADINLGTWYPEGGMYKIVEGMVSLARELGVKFHYNQEVKRFKFENNTITNIVTDKRVFDADVVVCSGDYQHLDQHVLPEELRNYTKEYWNKRIMAPSSLIFYIGVNKRINNLKHHNLFFDRNFESHAVEIYDEPKWPTDPLFYVCCPSQTDSTVAPENCENLFILIPVAPGLADDDTTREKYFAMVIRRLEKKIGESILPHIIFKKSYAHTDFIRDYHAFKGNAYGLANTLMQTALLKPSIRSKRVKNLYFTGQLTVPGPGVPPALISGQVVAKEVQKDFFKQTSVVESLT